jgi:putative salt-induced outer membrane protein
MQIQSIRRVVKATAIVLALALPATPAFAQWTGKGQAGIAIAGGNTSTESANAKIAVGKKVDAWEHSAGLAANYVSDDIGTTAQRWELSLQSRYAFSGNTFWYGGFRYEDDRFSGFDHQGIVSTGVGRKFIDNDTTKFSAQVGVGYKFFETRAIGLIPSDSDSAVAFVAGADFEHKLNDMTTVFDHFSTEVASGNTFYQNELGLAVKMSDRMSLALAYALRHNTDPPAGFKKTDTLSTVNLVYEVK